MIMSAILLLQSAMLVVQVVPTEIIPASLPIIKTQKNGRLWTLVRHKPHPGASIVLEQLSSWATFHLYPGSSHRKALHTFSVHPSSTRHHEFNFRRTFQRSVLVDPFRVMDLRKPRSFSPFGIPLAVQSAAEQFLGRTWILLSGKRIQPWKDATEWDKFAVSYQQAGCPRTVQPDAPRGEAHRKR
jgi:hypothetical protein